MNATKVNAGLVESNGRLLLGIWRDSLHVTCGLTACTPGSAPGPTLGNEYGKTLPFYRRALYWQRSTDGLPAATCVHTLRLPSCVSCPDWRSYCPWRIRISVLSATVPADALPHRVSPARLPPHTTTIITTTTTLLQQLLRLRLRLQLQQLLQLQPFNGLFVRTSWVSRYQKGKTSLTFNAARDDEVLGCSRINWTIRKQSAPRSRQITTPNTSSLNFYRPF